MSISKLTNFTLEGRLLAVTFVETYAVKEGVDCDVYSFPTDPSKDWAIVHVIKGQKTPLQKVLGGTRTIEGLLKGVGTLTVGNEDGETEVYYLEETDSNKEIQVTIGQTMQWEAGKVCDLIFYEICEPPYQQGRFENLPE